MLLSRSLTLAVLGLAVSAPALLGGCDRQSGEKAQPQASTSPTAAQTAAVTGTIDRSHKGSALPDFTLADQAGRQLPLRSLKGKPLLINLWATWCAPCITELPMLESLAGQNGGAVKVLTVAQDMTNTEKVSTFFAERVFRGLEPWLDPKNALAFHYGAGTLPTTIYYNADGREVWRFNGGHDWSSAETTAMLAEGQ